MSRAREKQKKPKDAPADAGGPSAPPRSFMGRLWHEWVRPLLVVGFVLLSFRSAIADWNDVPSGSMKPTILEGDRVFVNKLAYDLKVPFVTRGDDGSYSVWDGGRALSLAHWADPARGDVVVMWSPADGKRLVKRVVAVPGDSIEVRRHRLLINDRPAEYEPLSLEKLASEGVRERPTELRAVETVEGRSHAVMASSAHVARADFGPLRLGQRQYFVMGDHRDDSFDSRFFGPVDRGRIVGRATTIVLSLDIKHGWRPRWKRFFRRLR